MSASFEVVSNMKYDLYVQYIQPFPEKYHHIQRPSLESKVDKQHYRYPTHAYHSVGTTATLDAEFTMRFEYGKALTASWHNQA